LDALVASHRQCTADLVAHLAELDSRSAVIARGYPSLFQYCVEHLHFSEDEACRRIEAARMAQRFPAILALLVAGSITLSSLALLKHHITLDNHQELLAGIAGRSCRSAEEWLAARFPRVDLPARIRQLPTRIGEAGKSGLAQTPLIATGSATTDATPPAAPPVAAPSTPPSATRPARVEPLSQDRFALQVTISRSLKNELDLVRDLMRHRNPSGDLERVLGEAIAALRSKLEKQKLGATTKPRTSPTPPRPRDNTTPASRHIPSAVKRAIVAKEGLRCSFVGIDGRRCKCRAFLEYDHVTPAGLDGNNAEDNVRLLCRAHNQYAAERIYGAAKMRRSKPPAASRVPSAVELGVLPRCRARHGPRRRESGRGAEPLDDQSR
jgi:5-methylcytosine-specific restriction endonuclease McrA